MRFLNRKLPGGRFRGEQEETIAKDLPSKPARRKANRASTQDLAERVPSDSKDERVQRHQSSDEKRDRFVTGDDSVPKERGRAKSGSGRRRISQEKIQKTKTRKKTKVPAGRKKNARSFIRVVKRASRRPQSASPERGDGKIRQRSESVPPRKRRQKASEENVRPRRGPTKSNLRNAARKHKNWKPQEKETEPPGYEFEKDATDFEKLMSIDDESGFFMSEPTVPVNLNETLLNLESDPTCDEIFERAKRLLERLERPDVDTSNLRREPTRDQNFERAKHFLERPEVELSDTLLTMSFEERSNGWMCLGIPWFDNPCVRLDSWFDYPQALP
jgi:hypothetical protein